MAVKCILTGQTPSVLDGVTENVQTQLNDKVDKVTGKGLSTNDYTSAEKTKLSGIETGAQKNTITGVKGNAETTYRTGNVNITATNIGLGNVNNTSDAEKPISTATKTALDGKQAKVTGAATTITDSNLTADRALISNSSGKVEVSAVTSTELGYLDGVTSNIQTQLNNKLSSAPVASVNNKTGAVTLAKGDVGLGNVDNTSDANKPISNATQAALNDKQSKITANGILKGNGTGGVSAAVKGTDYFTPADVNEIAAEAAKKVDISDKVSKSGDTMTGKLTVPQVETGADNSNFFQCRKFRGEGDANTYYHAIDFGYANHDKVDFHEYGGIWNFFKNTSGKANEGVLCGSITSNGWEGRAKLKSGSTMVTSQLTENSDAIATTAFVHGLVDNVKHYSASNPPPYPVTSVNGKTGAVQLTTADIDLDSSIMFLNKTNTMTANGKITMDSTYTPSANGDVATKQYVDNSTPATFTASKAGTVPASGGGTTKYLRADGTWTTIDKTPVIGTNTNYAIYIGTTAPASGTTPLLWIDTTSSTGFLKYRSSNTSAWTAVPVAWTE